MSKKKKKKKKEKKRLEKKEKKRLEKKEKKRWKNSNDDSCGTGRIDPAQQSSINAAQISHNSRSRSRDLLLDEYHRDPENFNWQRLC